MNKKGQGALEFLTTYGWAFLVVLVLVGSMSQLGIFDRFGGSRCVSSQGFLCAGSEVNDANQKFKFKNTLGEDVAISNATATVRSTGEVINCDVPSSTVSDGSSFEVSCQGDGLTSGKRENLDVQFNYYPATSTDAYAKPVYADVSEFVENYAEFDQVTTGGERTASSCGITFEAGKTYKLNNSVTSGNNCFTINEAGVTLDCQDYSITGSGAGYGVNVQANNVVIKNCNITNFNRGIYVKSSTSSTRIEDNYLAQYGGGAYSIYVDSYSSSLEISRNVIRGTAYGIYVAYQSQNAIIENNDVDLTLTGYYYGIYAYYPIGASINNNDVILRGHGTATGDALTMSYAKNTIVQNNVVDSYDRTACTFSADFSVSASVPGITATGNKCTARTGFPGLWLNSHLKYSDISNNEFKGLGGLGAQIGNDLTGTTFSNNIFRGNNFGALTFHPAAYYGTFTDNTIEGYDSVPAIFAYYSNYNHHNTFSGNTLSAASGVYVISMNSQSYANSFVDNEITGSKWVTNGNDQNTFNDSTRGNKYYLLNGNPASSVLNFVDGNADGWADSGTNVPLSSSTASAYWAGSGSDAHPSMD